jgi:hypothetical protein
MPVLTALRCAARSCIYYGHTLGGGMKRLFRKASRMRIAARFLPSLRVSAAAERFV